MSAEQVQQDAEGKTFTLRIHTWVNGVPTVVREIPGFKSKSDGIERLRSIGHYWDYNINYYGDLTDNSGKRVAQLNIWEYTYGVVDLEKEG